MAAQPRKPRPLTIAGIGTYTAELDSSGFPFVDVECPTIMPRGGYVIGSSGAEKLGAWLTAFNAWAKPKIDVWRADG